MRASSEASPSASTGLLCFQLRYNILQHFCFQGPLAAVLAALALAAAGGAAGGGGGLGDAGGLGAPNPEADLRGFCKSKVQYDPPPLLP